MSLNLLSNSHSPHLINLEWNYITLKISQKAKLQKNIDNFLNSNITTKSIEAINNDYKIIDFFFNKINHNQHLLYDTLLSNLPKNDEYLTNLNLIKKGGIISLNSLHELALFVETLVSLFIDLAEIIPYLSVEHTSLEKKQIDRLVAKFIKPLRVFVAFDGTIDYLKHPELNEIQTSIDSLEMNLRKSLQELIHQPTINNILQYPSYDIINDHYILPFKSDSYTHELGQIISHSNRGFTLYVEPVQISDKNNKRIKLLAKRDELINKICHNFSTTLYENHDLLSLMVELIHSVDFHLAKALFSFENNLVRPVLSNKNEIKLNNFFHPLIKNPIKNDFELDCNQIGVIISGPNTGGKTAALKAIALTHLFVHFGLFVPADSAILYPFSAIFYIGNDQQNLAQGLSSFSSEVRNYIQLFEELTDSNLIIIDEIFNSTSSEEASALSMALINQIVNTCSCKLFISTHHHLLKKRVQTENKYISAHVGFDLEKEIPTYKIFYGTPGSSYALQIFKNLTEKSQISKNLIDNAHALLDKDVYNYEKLLADLNLKETQLAKLIEENEIINKKIKDKEKNIEGILKLKMQSALSDFDERLQKILNKSHHVLEEIKNGVIDSEKKLNSALRNINSEVSHEKYLLNPPKSQTTKVNYKIPNEIKENHRYYSIKFGKSVLVSKINVKKNSAIINLGKISTTINLDDLRDLPHHGQPSKVEINFISINNDISPTIDCRGMRIEEFETVLEKHFGYLLSHEIPFLEVIHGHGEGVLKKYIRDYLKKHQAIFEMEKSDDANDGYTRIILKA